MLVHLVSCAWLWKQKGACYSFCFLFELISDRTNVGTMNTKRTFGAIVVFLFAISLAFCLHIDFVSAAPDASSSQLGQDSTDGALVISPGNNEDRLTIFGASPGTVISIRNLTPELGADVLYSCSQESGTLLISAGNSESREVPCDPSVSQIQLINVSQDSNSRVEVFF